MFSKFDVVMQNVSVRNRSVALQNGLIQYSPDEITEIDAGARSSRGSHLIRIFCADKPIFTVWVRHASAFIDAFTILAFASIYMVR